MLTARIVWEQNPDVDTDIHAYFGDRVVACHGG